MIGNPAGPNVGVSSKRDRMWGFLGGLLGLVVGGGSAAIAVFIEGADLFASSSPYPPFFTKRQVLVYDVFLGVLLFVGVGFAVVGILLTRRGKYPRTDALGSLLASAVLSALAGSLLLTRLIAVIRGPLTAQ